MRFQEPTRKQKVIYIHNFSEFDKFWNHCTSNTTQIRNKWDCRKSNAKMKERTFAMLLQSSSVTNGGRIPMECYFPLRNIQDLLSDGKTQYQRRFGMPLMDQYRSEQWSNITLFVRKSNLDCISSQPKFYKVYLSVMCCMQEESGKETLWSQTLKNWRRWTHRNSTLVGSIQRKCERRKQKKISYSLQKMDSQNFSWERTASEKIHFNPGTSRTRRRTRNFFSKITRIAWRWRQISFFVTTLFVSESNCTSWKSITPFPLKYIDAIRTTCTFQDRKGRKVKV